jgi:hypothetical protein
VKSVLAKLFLIVIGFAFGLFCLLLANHGVIRLYGWSRTGRMAPPDYPGFERYDVISFSAEPLRAFLEVGGSAFLVAISLTGLMLVVLTFWRGPVWWRNLPDLLPVTFVLMFSGAIGGVFTGRADFILPGSLFLGSVAVLFGWIFLRLKGLPITARVSDVVAFTQRNGSARPQRPAWLGFATAALLTLLPIMKLMAANREMARGIVIVVFAFFALGLMTYGAIAAHRNSGRSPGVGAIMTVTIIFASVVMITATWVSQ